MYKQKMNAASNKKALPVLLIGLWLVSLALPARADKITFSGDSMQAVMAKGRERTILKGNAYLITEDTEIHAQQIELFGEDFIFALCTGSVTVEQTEDELAIRCDKLFYNRRDKIIRLSGNAVMEDRKNEVVVKGGLIENRDSEDVTLIQVGARILKKDLVCRSHMARYFRETQILELYGEPQVIKKEDVYEAAKIVVDIKNDKVTLEGDVSAQVHYKSEEKKPEEESVQPESSATPAPSSSGQTVNSGLPTPSTTPAPSTPEQTKQE